MVTIHAKMTEPFTSWLGPEKYGGKDQGPTIPFNSTSHPNPGTPPSDLKPPDGPFLLE